MNNRRSTILAWTIFGLIVLTETSGLILILVNQPAEYQPSLVELLDPFISITAFAFVGALIISRQPRNVIGWLMMLPGMSFDLLVSAYLGPFLSNAFIPPESPSPVFLVILWFSNWNWWLWLLSVMFIMVLFPTGRPLNRRWGWLISYGLGLLGVFILFGTFVQTISPATGDFDWTVRNPIGFLDVEGLTSFFFPLIVFTLPTWVFLCAVSLFVRFRNARGVEREQIKWLFYACAVFVLFLIPPLIIGFFSSPGNLWASLETLLQTPALQSLNLLVQLTIPVSIAIAILRYRLYDIDIIIRRTLVYGALTLLLVGVYFGSVVLLTQAFRALAGQDSPVAIVISTLVIAALFNPLRGRVQEAIDRRFYRRKYDAQQALGGFAATARDEVELDQLTEHLLSVVQESMQPEKVSLWLRAGDKK